MKCRWKPKVMTETEWRREHQEHGPPEKVKSENQPPAGYTLYEVRCPCGAKLITSTDNYDEQVAV